MPKNITISLPDDVATQMDVMQDVNWSAVAKSCINRYIELRQKPDLSLVLEKLEKEKGEEYVKGRTRADQIVSFLGYVKFNLMMSKYRKKLDELNELEMTGGTIHMPPWESLPDKYDIMCELLTEKKLLTAENSSEYLKGLHDRLLEIDKAISK